MATRKSITKPLGLAAALAVPIALGGCGVVQQVAFARAKARLAVEQADCRALSESYAQKADCLTAAEDETIRPFVNDGDVLTLGQARRKLVAVKLDRGEITEDEARLEMAQIMSAATNEDIQRSNAARAVSAQEMLGRAAMMRATQPPPMVNTTCSAMGNSVNCTSY